MSRLLKTSEQERLLPILEKVLLAFPAEATYAYLNFDFKRGFIDAVEASVSTFIEGEEESLIVEVIAKQSGAGYRVAVEGSPRISRAILKELHELLYTWISNLTVVKQA